MRAIAIEEFGGREQLQLMDLPQPEIDSERVLIRVRAAGVGPWDVLSRQGIFGGQTFPRVIGAEAAGVVERVGEGVTDLREGDEVYSYPRPTGCYAEYLSAPAARTARKPASLSFGEAAGVPVAGTTAIQGLAEELDLREGETLLVTAASGGVGSFAVQIGVALGARVVGTASPANHDYLTSLGATGAVDYRQESWPSLVREAAGGEVDAVLDCAGGDTLERSFEAIRDGGRAVYIAPQNSEPQPPRGIQAHFYSGGPDAGRLARLAELVDEGRVSVHLEDVLPLEEAAEAHRRIEAGHTTGKVVLRVG